MTDPVIETIKRIAKEKQIPLYSGVQATPKERAAIYRRVKHAIENNLIIIDQFHVMKENND